MRARRYGLVHHAGLLYVADANNERIVAFPSAKLSEAPTLAFGSKGGEPGQLDRPRGLAVGGEARGWDSVLVAEFGNNRVSIFRACDGVFNRTVGGVATAGTGDALPLRRPYGVLEAHGLLLVSEFEGQRLCVFSAAAEYTPLQVKSSRDLH